MRTDPGATEFVFSNRCGLYRQPPHYPPSSRSSFFSGRSRRRTTLYGCAGAAKVTALGTAFAIRYGNDNTEVAVNKNAVQIDIDGSRTAPVRVSEGEQAIYDYAKGQMAIAPVDSLVAFAWRRGQIVLDNTPLSYVIEEMNRHFYGRIVVADSRIANRRVSGTMKITDTDVALAFVTQALHVKAMHFGPLIVIRE